MHRFLIIIEKAGDNYSAYPPDLPGCVTTGDTWEEAESNMHHAVRLHLEILVEDGEPIPESVSFASYVALP